MLGDRVGLHVGDGVAPRVGVVLLVHPHELEEEPIVQVEQHGRIIERGRHAELLARDGAYAALWHRQQEAARRAVPTPEDAGSAADGLAPA